jgi:mRNA-degrading endonuclease RelE of RelBE toxin-antitoxin system
MIWQIELARDARYDLASLDGSTRKRVAAVIADLQNTFFPAGAKKLSPKHEERYRIRAGEYRIIYRVFKKDRLIVVTAVVKRGQAGLYH